MNEIKITFAPSTRAIFFLLIVCTAMKSFKVSIVDKIGTIGLYLSSVFYVLIMFFLLAKKVTKSNSLRNMLFIVTIFLSVLLINNFNNYYLRGFINIFEVIVAVSIIITWTQVDFFDDDVLRDKLFKFYVFYLLLNCVYLAFHYSEIGFYGSFYTGTDYFGELMSLYFFLCIMIYLKTGESKFKNIGILFVPFVVFSGSRTWSAIIIICTVFYLVTKRSFRKRISWNFILVAFYFVMYRFVDIYVNSVNTPEGQFLNDLSIKYLHKQFFSGRNYIWENALCLISKQPVMGYGTGALYSNYVSDSRSIHSYYLQLLFQDGWIGLIIFVTITFVIWNILFTDSKVTRYCSGCFICILLANFFEVSILQNQMNFVLLNWLIISVGISEALKMNVQRKTTNDR